MIRRTIITTLALASITASLAQATTWEIDKAHSNVSFKVRHLMISNVQGSFGAFSEPSSATKRT